jgi:hypothetical protein
MKKMKHVRQVSGCILLLLVVAGCCEATPGADGQDSTVNGIVSRFPGYHLLKLAERDAETRAYVLRHFPKGNSSVVHADFDGDGHLDYALLLKDNKSGSVKVVILLCSEDAECKSVYNLDDPGSDSGELYIRPVPIGSRVAQTEAIDTKNYPAPVRLRSTGIELTVFEKASVVYYWDRKRKKIETVQTGD